MTISHYEYMTNENRLTPLIIATDFIFPYLVFFGLCILELHSDTANHPCVPLTFDLRP